MAVTPIFSWPIVRFDQQYKEADLATFQAMLEAILSGIRSRSTTTPPAIVNGEAYIVPANATGAWAGQTGKIAIALNGAWRLVNPPGSAPIWSIADDAFVQWTGSAWEVIEGTGDMNRALFATNPAAEDGVVDIAVTVLDGAIDTEQLADGAVTAEKLDPGISIGVADGSITTIKLANNAVTVPKINATGTPSNTTFLRGDGSWAVPAGVPGGGEFDWKLAYFWG